MACTITTTDWQTDRESLRHIRNLVFIQEQQVPVTEEWDDKDETAIHFLVQTTQEHAIGCARLLIETNRLHIGRVAILPEYREEGIGRQLMQFVLSWCAQQYPKVDIYLHAQTSRIRFYKHFDFVPQGDIFMDAGIAHIEMWHRE